MIYLLLGKDFNIVNARVSSLVSSLNISNIIKYDFSETDLTSIINEVNYIDLFNEKKLLIVSNFSLKNVKDELEELLTKYINNMGENVIIFKCIDESLDERRSLTKLLKSKCTVEVIEKLDYKTLHEYVVNMFKKNGITTNFNQVKKILDLCEYNPDYTINEVEKLLIYKIGDTSLSDEDIDNVISKNNEKEMFNLNEYIMKKDIKNAINSYKILTSSNIDASIILDSIAKQFRILLEVKSHNNSNDNDLGRKLGVNPFVITKLRPFVNDYSNEDIINVLYKLSNLDINIKRDSFDKDTILESFLIAL